MSGSDTDANEAGLAGRQPRHDPVLNHTLTVIENVLVVFAGFVVIAMMLLVTADVISRSLFNFPLPNSYEYMELGMVFAVYLGAAQVQREKRHVTIDTVIKHFPDRLRATVELMGCLIGLVLMAAIGWWGALAAWNSYVTSEYVGSVARLPVLPARLALVIGVIALLIRLLFDAFDYACKIGRFGDESDVVEVSD
jgi:TRAP-type C4-dicarboxylate transport system permease small subunit